MSHATITIPVELRNALEAYVRRQEEPPELSKLEFVGGKFYHSDAQCIIMLGWLLEMMGADAAVRLGDPEVWRAAVAGLSDSDAPDRDT